MQKDCSMFTNALELRGNKTRKLKSPCRGLTTATLRQVSLNKLIFDGLHKYIGQNI